MNIVNTGGELKFNVKSDKNDTLIDLDINLPSNYNILELLELKVKAKRRIPGSVYFNLSCNFNLKTLKLKHANSGIFFNKLSLTNSKNELNKGDISFNCTIIEYLNVKNVFGYYRI